MFDDELEGCGNHNCVLTADEYCQKILLGIVRSRYEKIF